MLADHAKTAGIQLASARQPHHIPEAWLREQYLTQRRSFPAIAAELGVCEMTVTRAAHDLGIASRPAGIASHPDVIGELDDHYPPDLRSAVNNHLRGWLRLRRFQQAMQYPSLNVASRHIGAYPTALLAQIQRLERDVGTLLVNRATPRQPMTPTPRGAQLLRDLQHPDIQALLDKHGRPPRGWKPNDPRRTARTHSGVSNPARAGRPTAVTDHHTAGAVERPRQPSHLPDDASLDLRRALAGPRGWNRLRRFVTAMDHPTLTEAAQALGINLATLIEQLQRLEHDVGAPLFHRATPASQPQRPTRRGAQLLHALQRPNIQAVHVMDVPSTHTAQQPGTGPAAQQVLPRDLLRGVQGQISGWIRVERFATTMAHASITEAAVAIGINRTTLIEQLHRLERDVGTALFHRATADGQPHRPTRRGNALLQALRAPDIHRLREARARLPRVPTPGS
jgi:DNA-binding transcriptional LysR family regulator